MGSETHRKISICCLYVIWQELLHSQRVLLRTKSSWELSSNLIFKFDSPSQKSFSLWVCIQARRTWRIFKAYVWPRLLPYIFTNNFNELLLCQMKMMPSLLIDDPENSVMLMWPKGLCIKINLWQTLHINMIFDALSY